MPADELKLFNFSFFCVSFLDAVLSQALGNGTVATHSGHTGTL